MKNLRSPLAKAFFFLVFVVALDSVGDLFSPPGKMGQPDEGFMTDRLLEEDIRRGAAPLDDRDRDKDSSDEERSSR